MPASVDANAWKRVLRAAERVDWRLDDVLVEDARFDFSRPFLPDALSGASELVFLDERERLILGHVRARGYLGLFGVVEELILPFVLAQARASSLAELGAVRALLCFAAEEAKHIELFRRFARVFARGFEHPAELVAPADAFARAVLAHSELGVALSILHIEWMTQEHWLSCVRSDTSLEPAFKRLLHHHWMEEAQHARLDALLVSDLAARATSREREQAVDDYLRIVTLLDGALREQLDLDRHSFEGAIGRALSPPELSSFHERQLRSHRETFLLAGMQHPRFLDSAREVHPDAPERLARKARELA